MLGGGKQRRHFYGDDASSANDSSNVDDDDDDDDDGDNDELTDELVCQHVKLKLAGMSTSTFPLRGVAETFDSHDLDEGDEGALSISCAEEEPVESESADARLDEPQAFYAAPLLVRLRLQGLYTSNGCPHTEMGPWPTQQMPTQPMPTQQMPPLPATDEARAELTRETTPARTDAGRLEPPVHEIGASTKGSGGSSGVGNSSGDSNGGSSVGGSSSSVGGGSSKAQLAAGPNGGNKAGCGGGGGYGVPIGSESGRTASPSSLASMSGHMQLQEEGKQLKYKGDAALRGLEQAWYYVSAALCFMKGAYLLERQNENTGIERAQKLYSMCADFWKRPTASTLEGCDQYLMAAVCYKCAAACTMRAFKLRQKEYTPSMIKKITEELRPTELRPTELRPADVGRASSVVQLTSQTNARMISLLAHLFYASSSVEDYEHGASLTRAMEKETPKEISEQIPSLEGFAALSTHELLEQMQRLPQIIDQMRSRE